MNDARLIDARVLWDYMVDIYLTYFDIILFYEVFQYNLWVEIGHFASRK